MQQPVVNVPHNHDCEKCHAPYGSEGWTPADPKQTIRVGSKHYHFCRVHGSVK